MNVLDEPARERKADAEREIRGLAKPGALPVPDSAAGERSFANGGNLPLLRGR